MRFLGSERKCYPPTMFLVRYHRDSNTLSLLNVVRPSRYIGETKHQRVECPEG